MDVQFVGNGIEATVRVLVAPGEGEARERLDAMVMSLPLGVVAAVVAVMWDEARGRLRVELVPRAFSPDPENDPEPDRAAMFQQLEQILGDAFEGVGGQRDALELVPSSIPTAGRADGLRLPGSRIVLAS